MTRVIATALLVSLTGLMTQPVRAGSCGLDIGQPFEHWPVMRPLAEPVPLKAPSGLTMNITAFAAEQVIGRNECIASILVDDDPTRGRVGFGVAEGDLKKEKILRMDHEFAKTQAVTKAGSACQLSKMKVLISRVDRNYKEPYVFRAQADGSLKERDWGIICDD